MKKPFIILVARFLVGIFHDVVAAGAASTDIAAAAVVVAVVAAAVVTVVVVVVVIVAAVDLYVRMFTRIEMRVIPRAQRGLPSGLPWWSASPA